MGARGVEELFFVEDGNSGRCVLVDSGAQRRVLPARSDDTLISGRGPRLEAVNGTPIWTFCIRDGTVCFNG